MLRRIVELVEEIDRLQARVEEHRRQELVVQRRTWAEWARESDDDAAAVQVDYGAASQSHHGDGGSLAIGAARHGKKSWKIHLRLPLVTFWGPGYPVGRRRADQREPIFFQQITGTMCILP